MLENSKMWLKFKSNKRSLFSLYIFIIFFSLSIFAEFISNDKPLVMNIDNQLYFPIIATYCEKELGGSCTIASDCSGWGSGVGGVQTLCCNDKCIENPNRINQCPYPSGTWLYAGDVDSAHKLCASAYDMDTGEWTKPLGDSATDYQKWDGITCYCK